jgi:energy-coupling factor transporter ATP-binding protein EcfA2
VDRSSEQHSQACSWIRWIFDEPLANLDPLTGQRAIELIHHIHEQSSRTIIIIEHRLEDVLHREVDRIIVVNEGRIIADMTPDELLSTHILVDAGIREPLYIAALRFAGCTITPEMRPQHVNSLVIDDMIDPLHAGYKDNERQGQNTVNEPLLELRNVDFGYEEGKLILDDISLSVNKGEMLSIVGKNGAGKSTISKLICGFYKPNAGSIWLDGNDLKSFTIKERSAFIGFVLQNPNQMISKPMLFDEVALGLTIREIPEEQVRERVHQVLKVCGLYEFRHWPISALSFGQKKRVTIASILVLNPQMIILDEPTAGQDYKHYNEIMKFLMDLNQSGVTIVMITHDMHLMMEYTQRTYVISDGKVIACGTPTEILSDSLVVDAANLKGTSVLELAERAGFADPQEFVRRFTERDKEVRG